MQHIVHVQQKNMVEIIQEKITKREIVNNSAYGGQWPI